MDCNRDLTVPAQNRFATLSEREMGESTILQSRSKLWPTFKEMKRDCPRAKVHIVYPARLIKDGRLVHDERPEWSKYMGTNRINQLNNIGRVHTHSIKNLALNGHPIDNKNTAPQCTRDVTTQVFLLVDSSSTNLPVISPNETVSTQPIIIGSSRIYKCVNKKINLICSIN